MRDRTRERAGLVHLWRDGRHIAFGSGYQSPFFFGRTDMIGAIRVET
jgi:hypothetical protein